MVENNLGITFIFGDKWRLSSEQVQKIPVYDEQNEPVTRKVWLMLSEKCFKSQQIMDFVSMVEEYYHVNSLD